MVLVEITRDERGFKGTWYRKGERHYVRRYPRRWRRVYAAKWRAAIGGINEGDCRVIAGPIVAPVRFLFERLF